MNPTFAQQTYIFTRDGHVCMYCKTNPAEICDHVVPVCKGGTKDPMNLVACCKPCNDSKLDKTLPEDLAKIIKDEITANTEKYLGSKAS